MHKDAERETSLSLFRKFVCVAHSVCFVCHAHRIYKWVVSIEAGKIKRYSLCVIIKDGKKLNTKV
jgi:hypothetical protein